MGINDRDNMRQPDSNSQRRESPRINYLPSHSPFLDLIDFSIRGRSSSYFQSVFEDDHVSHLCMLHLDDVSALIQDGPATTPGQSIRMTLDELEQKIETDNDLESAETLFSVATYASFAVMSLYLRHRDLFDRIAPRRNLLPQLASIHPDTASVMHGMLRDSRLGTLTEDGARILSKPWFTSDTPANVYARAIIASVYINGNLQPPEIQQKSWESFDRQHGCVTRVLPLPSYAAEIAGIPIPFGPDLVEEYWKAGKKIIMEEIPDFIDFPEWESYHSRHYKGGAKPGAIRSAIFRDILTSLRQIAGTETDPRS